MWVTEGPKTDPAADVILADTGSLPAGVSTITIVLWSDVNCIVNFVQRNALNTTDVNVQPLQVAGSFVATEVNVSLLLNQRLLLRNDSNITGHVQASIIG